jgi:hypothetical protein
MNKQELIKEVKEIGIYGLNIFGTVVEGIPTQTAIKLIKQLDEPKKVTIPQFVAEHIEWTKEEDFHLLGAMNRENFGKKLEDWFYTDDNMELFARAWLDGYEEVEEEKRYRVRFKGLDKDLEYLNFKHGHVWVFSDNIENEEYRTAHTRKELEEASFDWVFDCSGIEVQEVEG